MIKTNKDRNLLRQKRHLRIRTKINGTKERPRLCVYRSSKNIYAQLIDDDAGKTVASTSTLDSSFGTDKKSRCNIKYATEVGKKISQIAKDKNVTAVVFDKNGYRYHGKIKALAEAARKGGLKF